MRDKLQGWDKKMLSKGGKEILLKTVAQSLPNYAMSMFLLPKQLCTEMENLMCRYWWKGASQSGRGIHWMSWDRMSRKKSLGGLGFRKLQDFNVALLGKQGWRLITNQDSIVSKIYKARYYPNDTFLTAKMGSNPSYIWRSIMEAQVMLKQGAVRRVGSGKEIDVLKDPWLHTSEDPFVQTEHMALIGTKVTSLMVMGRNEWDTDLINDIFIERDARLILALPINREEPDSWFWNNEKMGHYTVKSAYLLIQELKNGDSTITSNIWKQLWNLKVPLKVKHFAWRALSNCLPTKDQLLAKRVPVSILCPICNNDPEDVLHSLVYCPFAALCWSHLKIMDSGLRHDSFFEWLTAVFIKYKKREVEQIVTLCWVLWKNRNDVVWNQRGLDYKEVCRLALSILNEWKSAQDKSFDTSLGFMTQEDGNERWECPIEGTVKVNVDAAIFEESGSFSFSMLARNHEGMLMEAKTSCRPGNISPELAEAIGVREALSWVKSSFHQPVTVETDCLSLVQAIRCTTVNLSYLGRVVDDCKALVSELKQRHVTLNFVRRSANKVAHFLARYTSSIADLRWSGGNVYPELHNVLLNDLKS